jgi:hypothetical protein
MTGWRIGWVCGNADAVKTLGKLKDNFDSGVFQALQEAAVEALTGSQDDVAEMRRIYRERRDIFVQGLRGLGWDVVNPPATFYVWAKPPKNISSARTAERLLEESHIVCTPGNGFGPSGEGYVRFALTVPALRVRLEWFEKSILQRLTNLGHSSDSHPDHHLLLRVRCVPCRLRYDRTTSHRCGVLSGLYSRICANVAQWQCGNDFASRTNDPGFRAHEAQWLYVDSHGRIQLEPRGTRTRSI